MKTNNKFKINLPSIPGKPIRLRIQDIKKKGFNVQQQRFNQNKTHLVASFIETFQNLHQSVGNITEDSADKEQKDTQFTDSTNKSTRQNAFRYVMPEYKNTLVELLQREQRQIKLKQREQSWVKKKPEINKKSKVNSMHQRVQMNRQRMQRKQDFIENQYFVALTRQQQSKNQSKPQKPSAVFKNESRKKMYQREAIPKSQIPGPGYYQPQVNKKDRQGSQIEIQNVQTKQLKQQGLENLKQQTIKIFEKHNIYSLSEVAVEETVEKKHQNPDHMFAKDDRDRFGDQIFPIVLKTNVPGPGAYTINDNIEDRAKKAIILEQQRKLLKDWFNQ